ncbi:hypothetical protein [Rhizobium sp. WYJ-E13]|uniref:hypothetical protein n=1 Tax=Rhizobium sp. WYJ-E13 TaxID=2849093 RepID=UPI001C1EC55D|nr:hypothetical protein [Rhizobium sp. WYJ-E13]QWW71375.1 hypothetical protein KQ933_22225 [Rhizobium sp. WYJ-E13]
MDILVTYFVAAAIIVAFLLALASFLLFALWVFGNVVRPSHRLQNFFRRIGERLGDETEFVGGVIAFYILGIAFSTSLSATNSLPSDWLVVTAAAALVLAATPLAIIVAVMSLSGLLWIFYQIGLFLLRLSTRPRAAIGEAFAALRGIPALLLSVFLIAAAVGAIVATVGAIGLGLWWLLVAISVWIGVPDLLQSVSLPVYLLLFAILTLLVGFGTFTLVVIVLALVRLAVDAFTSQDDHVPRFQVPWNDATGAGQSVPLATALRRAVLASIGYAFGDLPGGHNERPVFRGSQRRADEAAVQRSSYVQSQLELYADLPPESELLEIPPALADRIGRRPLTPSAGDARIATLNFQQKEQEFVLFGRVADTLSCLLRTAEFEGVRKIEVLLRQLRWWEISPNEYPWIVVVRTDRRREVAQALRSMREWLGIGVHIARPGQWQPQFRCGSSGLTGTIDGYISPDASSERFMLTCSHVVGGACAEALVNRQLAAENHDPDAALLVPHACCDSGNDGRKVALPSKAELRVANTKRRRVRRAGGSARSGIGYIKYDLASCSLDGETLECFSHFVVENWPKNFLLNLLSWPPFFGRFSQPGDSGAWVLMSEKNAEIPIWFGIVAGGRTYFNRRESYIVMAEPLMDHFNRRLRHKSPLSAFFTGD